MYPCYSGQNRFRRVHLARETYPLRRKAFSCSTSWLEGFPLELSPSSPLKSMQPLISGGGGKSRDIETRFVESERERRERESKRVGEREKA